MIKVFAALYSLNLDLIPWQGFLDFLLNNLALRFLDIISALDIQGLKDLFFVEGFTFFSGNELSKQLSIDSKKKS